MFVVIFVVIFKLVGLYLLNKVFGVKDVGFNYENGIFSNVDFSIGFDGKGYLLF